MIFLYILLIVAGAFPLVAFMYKRKEHADILSRGVKTTAWVSHIHTSRRSKGPNQDLVTYTYLPGGSNRYYTGLLVTRVGQYKLGEQMELYYLAEKPQKKALPKTRYNTGGFLFVLGFFLFALFACYKIYEMVGDREYHFNP